MSSTPHDALRAPSGIDAFKLVVRYILEVNQQVEASQLRELVERTVSTAAGNAVMTTGQLLRQEGRQEGIREGRQEGERGVLLRQLRLRFGSHVDAAIEQRVATASSEQLLLWADRVLSAQSLAEVLAD